jgi:ribose 5-phosphate isomerase B
LESKGYTTLDKGAYSKESVDYPEFGHAVGNSVQSGESTKGIVVCGSGIGISMAANKVEGIRAALCTTPEHAQMSRLHNDANVLAIGARMTDYNVIIEIVDTWLNSEFEGGRHSRRVNKIEVS